MPPQRFWLVAAVAALALLAGYQVAKHLVFRQPDLSGLQATRFAAPRPIAPFELVDHNGSRFNNGSLQGKWNFVFFGYTHCPDVCPATLSVMNSVAGRLGGREDVRFIFVTIDPERDTPEQLKAFVSYFNSNFIGLTGTPESIGQLTRELGIMSMRVEEKNAAGYLMDHSASILLLDPDGNYHAVFSASHSAEQIAGDFLKLLRAY